MKEFSCEMLPVACTMKDPSSKMLRRPPKINQNEGFQLQIAADGKGNHLQTENQNKKQKNKKK